MTDRDKLTYPVWLNAKQVKTLLSMNLQTQMGDDIVSLIAATPNAQRSDAPVHQMLIDHSLNTMSVAEMNEHIRKELKTTEQEAKNRGEGSPPLMRACSFCEAKASEPCFQTHRGGKTGFFMPYGQYHKARYEGGSQNAQA